jgi:hypothetical protein
MVAKRTKKQAQSKAIQYIHVMNEGLKQLFPELGDERSPPWMGEHTNLTRLGKRAWEVGRQYNGGEYPKSDHEMLDYSLDYAEQIGSRVLTSALTLPPFQLRWIWAGRWYDQGMPRVVWEHSRFPEMLMASSADPSTLDLARPPWRAFLVDLPRDLMFTKSTIAGEMVALQQVIVLYTETQHDERVWAFMAEGPDAEGISVELWRHGMPTEKLLETGEEFYNPLYIHSLEKRDDRLFVLLGRLLVGLSLTLSDPTKMREAKNTKGRRGVTASAKKKRRTKPITRNYVIGAPTKLKVREALTEFVETGRVRRRAEVSPGVKTLVRGHWKMQPYGPKQSLRKLIHREPYWSPRDEDNDMPVVVRDRVIEDTSPSGSSVD